MRNDSPIQYREVELDVRGINKEAREVPVAFSSETAVERTDWREGGTYMEILDHGPGNADFARLNNGGAFLVNHSTDDQVGAVKRGTAKVGTDRVGRAVIKMSRSQRASEIFDDMVDGVRALISFGYKLTKELSREVINGVEHRRYAFQAFEISSVPIPADPAVGVMRSQSHNSHNSMSLEVSEPNSNHDKREIQAIADHLERSVPNIQQLASRAILEGTPLEEFRKHALALRPKPQPIMAPEKLDVSIKDLSRYSLARAITKKLEGRLDGIEGELSTELAHRMGKQPQGFFVPDEVLTRNAIAGTGTLGGMLVQTDNAGSQFIDLLRNKAQVLNLGARVLNLTQPTTIPRQAGSSTANWINGETASSTLSGINLQHITLTPKCIMAQTQYSKQLLMTGDPSIDALLKSDMAEQIGLAIDLAALHGSGSAGEPTGIINTSGIGSVLLATNGLALTNTTALPALCSLESVVAAANADQGSLGYLMRSNIRGQLKVTPRFANVDTPVWEGGSEGTVNGYRALTSQQISKLISEGTATTLTCPIFFGNWADVLLGSFGSSGDLVVDEFTLAQNRVVRLFLHRYIDVALRKPASMCVLGAVLGG